MRFKQGALDFWPVDMRTGEHSHLNLEERTMAEELCEHLTGKFCWGKSLSTKGRVRVVRQWRSLVRERNVFGQYVNKGRQG